VGWVQAFEAKYSPRFKAGPTLLRHQCRSAARGGENRSRDGAMLKLGATLQFMSTACSTPRRLAPDPLWNYKAEHPWCQTSQQVPSDARRLVAAKVPRAPAKGVPFSCTEAGHGARLRRLRKETAVESCRPAAVDHANHQCAGGFVRPRPAGAGSAGARPPGLAHRLEDPRIPHVIRQRGAAGSMGIGVVGDQSAAASPSRAR